MERTAIEIIEEMIFAYGRYEDAAKDRVGELLRELQKSDEALAARMKTVMERWDITRKTLRICRDGIPDGLPETNELCFAVLGYKLDDDGQMNDELIGRLTVALRCAEKCPNAYILCTGGGTAKDAPNLTEAGQMAAWLIEKGVDRARVIVEDASRSTGQNAIFSYKLLTKKYPSVKKIAIVTSDYHIVGGTFLFDAASILHADAQDRKRLEVVGNAAWSAPTGNFPTIFQAYALFEICRNRLHISSQQP